METFLHNQQRNATCAVAAIRTVLHRQFGVRVAEAALVALGTYPEDPILKNGSGTAEMRRMVRNASRAFNAGPPWTMRVRKHGTLRQLAYWTKHGRWPIVQVFVPEEMEHHAIVVVAVEEHRVRYFDPDPLAGRKLRAMSKERFFDWWLSPITNERWWAVVNGGDLLRYE
jgi:hypothetical protein